MSYSAYYRCHPQELNAEQVKQKIHQHGLPELQCSMLLAQHEETEKQTREVWKLKDELFLKKIHMEKSRAAFGRKLVTLAKADCMAISTNFYAAMPREIRDRVYSFLEPRGERIIDLDPKSIDGYKYIEVSGNVILDQVSHWLSPDSVGFNFANECAQIQFEQKTFVFINSGIGCIHSFLQNQHRDIGVDATKHIRRYQILLKNTDGPFGIEALNSEEELWKQSIYYLFRFKRASATVDFILAIGVSYFEADKFEVLLQYLIFLGPILHKLKDLGFCFTIKIRTHAENYVQEARDITYLWYASRNVSTQDPHRLSLTSDNENESDCYVMMQKFYGWEAALYEVFEGGVSLEEYARFDSGPHCLRHYDIKLEDEADYDFLSYIMMTYV